MRQDNLSLKHRGGLLLLAALLSVGHAEVLHINVRTGNDGNCGTQAEPVKTLEPVVALLAKGGAGEPAIISTQDCFRSAELNKEWDNAKS